MRRWLPVFGLETVPLSKSWSGGTRLSFSGEPVGWDWMRTPPPIWVQDALVKAYESLASCREPNHFGFWVGQIVRNRCLDFLKSAARRSLPLPVYLAANHGNPELEERRSRLRSQLNRALAMLPEEQREAFLMKHGEGLSYDEMAELACASVSAMKMRVHRATEALRDHLAAVRSTL